MEFLTTTIAGVRLIQYQPFSDHRGTFTRVWCADEFAANGIQCKFVQTGVSCNARAGTWRGMHFQQPPFEEHKLLRVTRGHVCDVVFDARPNSPTRGVTLQLDLHEQQDSALFVPAGCAHGFLTLVDDTVVEYQLSAQYVPQAARGIRYDDPVLDIDWPIPPSVMSDRDRQFPDFQLEVTAP